MLTLSVRESENAVDPDSATAGGNCARPTLVREHDVSCPAPLASRPVVSSRRAASRRVTRFQNVTQCLQSLPPVTPAPRASELRSVQRMTHVMARGQCASLGVL